MQIENEETNICEWMKFTRNFGNYSAAIRPCTLFVNVPVFTKVLFCQAPWKEAIIVIFFQRSPTRNQLQIQQTLYRRNGLQNGPLNRTIARWQETERRIDRGTEKDREKHISPSQLTTSTTALRHQRLNVNI